MFNNIGGKIKTLAVVLCIIGMVASLITALVLWSQSSYRSDNTAAGLLTLVGGCLVSWVSSFFTYGFGQLIEYAKSIDEKLNGVPAKQAGNQVKQAESLKEAPLKQWLDEGLITEEEYNKKNRRMIPGD